MNLVFVKFLPDNYHGSPEIVTKFPPDPFPAFATKEEVYDAWHEAGYNAYEYRDEMGEDLDSIIEPIEGESEEDREQRVKDFFFEEYGNLEFYYSLYMFIVDDMSCLDRIVENLEVDSLDAKEFIRICEGVKGVRSVVEIPNPQNKKPE
jgi:hypothetical protein